MSFRSLLFAYLESRLLGGFLAVIITGIENGANLERPSERNTGSATLRLLKLNSKMSSEQLYHAAAEVVDLALSKAKSLRTAVYEHVFEVLATIFGIFLQKKRPLLKLSCETVRCSTFLQQLLDDEASKRMAAPVLRFATTLKYRERKLAELGITLQVPESGNNTSEIFIPRYARINTLKWSIDEALNALKSENWIIKNISADDDFAYIVKSLNFDEVVIDPHIPELLIFPNAKDFYTYWMVQEGNLILQDKASCLPAFVLAPPSGSKCLDACAAPGNKSSHLAAIVGAQGTVFAFDRAAHRIKTMRKLITSAGVDRIVKIETADFLHLDMEDSKYAEVEYAIVDPPCSGSGMVKRMDEWTNSQIDAYRLEKLANLQAMLVKHALKLPNLRKLVYSTCSINQRENEDVVAEILTEKSDSWRIVHNVLPSWRLRGLDKFDFGNHCLRADPNTTLTNGFFVAVFERKKRKQQQSSAKEDESYASGDSRKKNNKRKLTAAQ